MVKGSEYEAYLNYVIKKQILLENYSCKFMIMIKNEKYWYRVVPFQLFKPSKRTITLNSTLNLDFAVVSNTNLKKCV